MELLKGLKPMDWFILAVAVYLLSRLNFGNLTTIDIVYLVSLSLWFIMLVIRLWLTRKASQR